MTTLLLHQSLPLQQMSVSQATTVHPARLNPGRRVKEATYALRDTIVLEAVLLLSCVQREGEFHRRLYFHKTVLKITFKIS